MVDGLEGFAIFKGMSQEELDAVGQHCEISTVRRGETIFKAGDPAHSLFLVRSGKIELRFKVVYYSATVVFPLDTVAAGDVCGWSAMVPPSNYTLTAVATEDSDLLQIKYSELQECCEANFQLGYIVMRNICRIIDDRYELACQFLVEEIQNGLKQKDPIAEDATPCR